MFLTETNLVHYLLGRGRIAPQTVVNGDVVIVNAFCRNRNFRVACGTEPGYFVKQVGQCDAAAISTLQREAACYQMAHSNPQFESLSRLMPRYYDFDPARCVLVLELLPAAENVASRQRRTGEFPTEIGRQMGEALGTFHGEAGQLLRNSPLPAEFPRQPPWILALHQATDGSIPGISAANVELVSMLRKYSSFPKRLNELRETWRYDGLIHGDIKWDNCVLCERGDGQPNFCIVDWELADVGDLAWDVGGVLQAYICAWIISIPAAGDSTWSAQVQRAGFKLEAMQPAINEFWRAYARVRNFDASAAGEMLVRSTRCGAARMIQTAFEHMQFTQQVPANMAMMLQVSVNILERPDESIRDLLAIAV